MMKKRVLMPLLVAGMMVASVMGLDSCKKEQQETSKAVFTDTETPVIEHEIIVEREGAAYQCPYCGVELTHGVEHWHYFGTPSSMRPPYGDDPEGFNVGAMMADDQPGHEPNYWPSPHFWGIAECLDGLSDRACPYSGVLHDDSASIQQVQDAYLHEFDTVISWDAANALLEERFHAHHIVYRVIVNGGMANTWHVGGGVPGWPGPHPENP